VADVAIFTSLGDHWLAIPRRYAIYHAADIARPNFSPMYAVTPEKTAPIRIPIKTLGVDQ